MMIYDRILEIDVKSAISEQIPVAKEVKVLKGILILW